MSQYVNETIAREAARGGTLIGKTERSRGTKGTWWQVYLYQGRIIACVMYGDSWVSCGEEITRDEVGMYVDDTDAALALIPA